MEHMTLSCSHSSLHAVFRNQKHIKNNKHDKHHDTFLKQRKLLLHWFFFLLHSCESFVMHSAQPVWSDAVQQVS